MRLVQNRCAAPALSLVQLLNDGQIEFSSCLVCTGARRNPATCGQKPRRLKRAICSRGALASFLVQLRQRRSAPASRRYASKSSFSIALVFTTSRRISASASTNQAPGRLGLKLLGDGSELDARGAQRWLRLSSHTRLAEKESGRSTGKTRADGMSCGCQATRE